MKRYLAGNNFTGCFPALPNLNPSECNVLGNEFSCDCPSPPPIFCLQSPCLNSPSGCLISGVNCASPDNATILASVTITVNVSFLTLTVLPGAVLSVAGGVSVDVNGSLVLSAGSLLTVFAGTTPLVVAGCASFAGALNISGVTPSAASVAIADLGSASCCIAKFSSISVTSSNPCYIATNVQPVITQSELVVAFQFVSACSAPIIDSPYRLYLLIAALVFASQD